MTPFVKPYARRQCCATAFTQTQWRFCPTCGNPLQSPCPYCGGGFDLYIPLLTEKGPTSECPRGHLLKSCPSCGKLHYMTAQVCDNPTCVGVSLRHPPSAWSEVNGGPRRQRVLRPDRGDPVDSAFGQPKALAFTAGDNLISAYGRLYFDEDPFIGGYDPRGEIIGGGATETIWPAPSATGLLAYSGLIAVLGRGGPDGAVERAYLLDPNSLACLTQVNAPGTIAQMVGGGCWWLFGRDGITIYDLMKVLNGSSEPLVTLDVNISLEDNLPPVRLDDHRVWLIDKSGDWRIVERDGATLHLANKGGLPNFCRVDGAFMVGQDPQWAVAIGQTSQGGGCVAAWTGYPEGQPSMQTLNEKVLPTWAAGDSAFYLASAYGTRILRLEARALQRDPQIITLPDTLSLKRLALIYEKHKADRLLLETIEGEFLEQETEVAGGRRTYSDTWRCPNKGQIRAWVPWANGIATVIKEDRQCYLQFIARHASD